MNTCPYCSSDVWHNSTVCSDCGIPRGPKPKAITQLESACAELKEFICQSEMPMHASFSDADSIAWRKKREYLLSNQAGDHFIERLKEADWLLANMRTSEVGYIAGSEWQVRYEAWKRSNGL